MATASPKRTPRASGTWASLANDTARPPSSAHQRGIHVCRSAALISSARPLRAIARIALPEAVLEPCHVERPGTRRGPAAHRVVEVGDDVEARAAARHHD